MKSRNIQFSVGLILGLVFIWVLFRGTRWNEVFEAIYQARIGWLAIALLLMCLTFIIRVKRWQYIVQTAGPVQFRVMFSATQIGFLGNFLLPARIGEVIRALVLARLQQWPFSKCFAFVALDRVTDLFGLLAVLGISLFVFRPTGDILLPPDVYAHPIPSDLLRSGALLLGLAILVGVGILVILYLNQHWVTKFVTSTVGRVSKGIAERINCILLQFADGMHIFRAPHDIIKALLYSLLTWLVAVLFLDAVLRAFSLDYPWYAPLIMQALIALFISMPGAPGFIGQYHMAIVAGLILSSPDTNLEVARAAAIMAHLLNLLPISAIGFWCLYMEQFKLMELKRAGEELEEHSEYENQGQP